jgi:ketosteroid isomerase-like protein
VTFYHSSTASIVELSAEGIAVSTGNSFVMPYVGIIEHRGGKITRYVDYWNPLVAMVAMGGLDAVHALGRHNPVT